MKWLSSYHQDLELAFTEAASILEALPVTHRQPALEFLDKFHPLKEERSKNYICYLLPLWMHELTGVPLHKCRGFAVANIFGMLYYQIIDAVMDDRDQASTSMLPLAEFIHLEFIHKYSHSFPATSSLWDYYRKYVAEWAQAVSTENSSDFFYENPVRMGHKASPVKLSIIAPLLLSHREELIPELEEAVDTVLITLQMLDDWQDWEKDLLEGNYNSLVSMVQTECEIPKDRRPTSEEINQAIYVRGLLSTYANRANILHVKLSKIQTIVPHLYDFHASLHNNIVIGAQHHESERNLLLQGGLNYYLSKIPKNS
ncbi:hypothetical protein FHR92_001935 [Fontibacillus solani]|uniref:Terpene synthase n=1 Tax=Fontibacillus solani TaxID=1572857 RepID=A0A7W3SSX1_9BACL|nr:hypothetical protein [Fontibacillus solani]MBA9085469.1 hypothetical protein [Fontibacillus solani]